MIWRPIVFLTFSVWTSVAFAAQPSFDCTKAATPVEKLICGDDALSQLDTELTAAFKAAYAASNEKLALLAGQRIWLSRRAECLPPIDERRKSANVVCLSDRYMRRVAFLDRGPDLSQTRICQSLAEAVTYAAGYVTGQAQLWNDNGILDDAALDVLGAVTIHFPTRENYSLLHKTKSRGDVSTDMIEKIKALDTDNNGLAHNYYVIGSSEKSLAISEYKAGTLYCQTSTFYRIGRADSLIPLDIDRPDGCTDDYDYFADMPSGGSKTNSTIIHQSPTINKVEIGVEGWDGSSFRPICLMTVNYDVALKMSSKSCSVKAGCDELSGKALDLARSYDKQPADSAKHASPPWVAVAKPPDFDDPMLPSENGWYHEKSGISDNLTLFELNAPVFTSSGSKYLFRISNGMGRDFIGDGYIVGVYDRDEGNPLAAFQIAKVRMNLKSAIVVAPGQTTSR